MSSYNNWLRKLESEREDRAFASKLAVFLIWAPCYIALGNGLLLMAIDPGGAHHYDSLLMASLLGLVAASISSNRRKILQQDKVIQQLEEQLREVNSHSQKSPAGDDQKASPEE